MQIYAISFGVYGVVSVFTLMIYGALPAIAAKNGLPPQQIGLLYLSMIPFMLSFFYSGLVESYRKKHACNFKRLCLTLGAVSILGFVLLGVVCTPSDILLMSVVFGVMCLLGACAIISLNAIAIEQTSADKKVALNTIMLLASGVGGVLGIVLALFVYEEFGFSVACYAMAICVAVLCLPFVLMSGGGKYGNIEPNKESTNSTTESNTNHIDTKSTPSILKTLKTPRLWWQLGFFCACMLPITLANTTSTMLLVYIGFSLQVVGIFSAILNCAIMFAGSPLAYLFIRALGFRRAFMALLGFCVVVFVGLVVNMWLWQNHAFIVLGLAGVSVYFCALFVFAYSLGMRWCEGSTQSGVDFSFLRLAENACFVVGGVLASQILGLFIAQEKLDSLSSSYSSDFIGISLREVLGKSGIESSVANGYGVLFCASLLFAIVALGVVVCNKKIA